MKLTVFHNYSEMSAAAADAIINCIEQKPEALLCFATGDTPKLTYQILVNKIKKEKTDTSRCFLVGLDEWLGIPPENSGSCYHFLHHYLVNPLGINPAQVHLFNAMTPNPEEECVRMNNLISEKGPVDFMVVGVGMNGHIGFNEPGEPVDADAHIAILDETTKTIGKKYFEREVVINKGITLGMKQVMQACTVVMIANGKKKAAVIKKALEGEISINLPASLIRTHSNGILMIDKEAASKLKTSPHEG